MEGIILRLAMHDDLDILASMNKQLIEDEKHDNKMNAAQLKERMRGFIDGNYNAYMFMNDGEAVGYADAIDGTAGIIDERRIKVLSYACNDIKEVSLH